MPKRSSSYEIDYAIVVQNFLNPQARASKSHHWFKSYGHFTEVVDFAYWLSFIGKGLRLQPGQQACLKLFKLNIKA